jgi:hypothetical protein
MKNVKGTSRKFTLLGTLIGVKVLGVATLLAFVFSLSTVSAQTSVNATGGDASGSGGSASYSVGQVVYTTNTGTSGSVTQGVQQPYEISVVTGIEEAKGINLSVSAYPNPTTDLLQLKVYPVGNSNRVESEKLKDLSYKLYDVTGKLLQNEKITGNQTSIVMSNLVPATYFLVVQTRHALSQQEIKTFKILKR